MKYIVNTEIDELMLAPQELEAYARKLWEEHQQVLYLLPELLPFWVVPTVYIGLTVLTTWLYITYVSRKIEFEKPERDE